MARQKVPVEPTGIVTQHKGTTIKYDERLNRWNAYQIESGGVEVSIMTAESLEALRTRLDKYEASRVKFARVPVVALTEYGGSCIRRGALTSLLPAEGTRRAAGGWVVWENRQREKIYDVRTLYLDSAKNGPVLDRIAKLDAELTALQKARQALVDDLETYCPPREGAQ